MAFIEIKHFSSPVETRRDLTSDQECADLDAAADEARELCGRECAIQILRGIGEAEACCPAVEQPDMRTALRQDSMCLSAHHVFWGSVIGQGEIAADARLNG